MRTNPSARLRKLHFASSVLLGVLAAGALPLASACSNGDAYAELKPLLCTQDDVGPGYQQLTDGDLSVRDLADLGPDATARVRELQDAGAQHGRFILFKEALPRPPFEPPVNVVCQALQFESAEAAQAFVRGLRPDDSLSTTVMAWLPRSNRHFVAMPLEAATPATGEVSARFAISGGSGEETMNAVYVASSEGAVVFTIVVGEADSTRSAEQVTRLAETLSARAGRLASSAR